MLALLSTITLVEAFSLLLTLISLVIAGVQTYRHRQAQNLLRKAKEDSEKSLWASVSVVLQTYDRIEDARILAREPTIDRQRLTEKISSARRSAVNLWLRLIEQAAKEVDGFNLETVERWKRLGRLENEWRLNQAKRLVPAAYVDLSATTDSLATADNVLSTDEFDRRKRERLAGSQASATSPATKEE